jgi:hypothetical protein
LPCMAVFFAITSCHAAGHEMTMVMPETRWKMLDT